MIKNIVYFTLLNFTTLAGIIVISEAMVYVGTFTASLLSATGLYYRYIRTNQQPSRLILTVTAAICSVITSSISLAFEYLLFGEFRHSLLTLALVSFFINFIFIVLIIKVIYEDPDENSENYPLTQSPITKALLKLWGKIRTSNYSSLTDEQLIRLSITLTPLMCTVTVIISLLLCSIIWLFLNQSVFEHSILVICAMALIIVLMHIWTINRHLVKQEMESRFLTSKK